MTNIVTFFYGILLTVLGIGGYFATGQASKTALIPCIFGFPVIALAILAWWKHSLINKTSIAAAAIALLGFGGTIRGVGGAISLMTGEEVARPIAVVVQAIMAIASIAFVAYIVGINLSERKKNQN